MSLAYEIVRLHDPPEWVKQPWDEHASALYDYSFFDCHDRLDRRKRARTINPQIGIRDRRSLKDIQRGCCPPRLLKHFVATESDVDYAKEALKLHKRGYFGGGG
jgi:hypothetical protein